MKYTAIRNQSGKVQVINGHAYPPDALVPAEDAFMPNGCVLPTLYPSDENTPRRTPRKG